MDPEQLERVLIAPELERLVLNQWPSRTKSPLIDASKRILRLEKAGFQLGLPLLPLMSLEDNCSVLQALRGWSAANLRKLPDSIWT